MTVAGLTIAAACAVPTSPAAAEPGKETRLAAITVGEPAGFSGLAQSQQAVVDVYFGGRRVGDTLVTYRLGRLTFSDPARLVQLIPNLADRGAVEAGLAKTDLPAHAGLSCTRGSDPALCGRLSPDDVGIIFDQDRFRVDLFVHPRLLALKPAGEPEYLPRPQAGLSVINAFGAVLSGSSGGPQYYNLRNRLVVGDADRRLRAELYYGSGFGVQADRLDIALDRPGWRYLGGAFWAPGTELLGRRKMIGVGAETQIDTRIDKDVLRGDPLVVFLGQRSRVDIVREGRLLSSGVYEAGNQSLDTANLPDGSYEVVLRIEEAGGAKREERRFFTKNPAIPALRQRFLFGYGGILVDDGGRGLLNPTGKPFAQVGAAFRPDRHIAFDGSILLSDKTVIGEIGASLIGEFGQLRAAIVGLSDGTAGALVRLSSSGNGRLNFNFDARRIEIGGSSDLAATSQALASGYASAVRSNVIAPYYPAPGEFTSLSGNVVYDMSRVQLRLAGTYGHIKGHDSTYSFGPSVRWEIVRNGPARLFANGDFTVTDRGRTGFLGLTLQVFGRAASLTAMAGGQSSAFDGERAGSAPVGSIFGAWQGEDVAGGEVQAGAGYERSRDRDLLSASAGYRGRLAAVRADLLHNLARGGGRTQYSLGMDTTVALGGDTVTFGGRQQSDGMIVVEVDGAARGHRFEVLVDDAPAGSFRSGARLPIPLIPYRQYDVRIRPADAGAVQYDSSPRAVSLYPGNVVMLTWRAKPVLAMFGRMVGRDGRPLRNASISAAGSIGQTDDEGYFGIETSPGAMLEVSGAGRSLCRISVPDGEIQEGYVRLGTLTCDAQQFVRK